MSQLLPISNIIRRVNEDEIKKEIKSYERIFIYNTVKKEIVSTPTVLQKMFSLNKSLDYYLLNLRASTEFEISNCILSEPENNLELDLTLAVHLELTPQVDERIIKSNISKLIRASKGFENIQQFLNDLGRTKAKYYSKSLFKKENTSIILNLNKYKAKILDALNSEFNAFGFDSVIQLHPKFEKDILSIIKFEEKVNVRLSDFRELVPLHIIGEFLIDKENTVEAVLKYGKHESLKKDIIDSLNVFMKKRKYKELLYEMDIKITDAFIQEQLKSLVKKYGRAVNHFYIKHIGDDKLNLGLDIIEVPVLCDIKGYAEKIKVDNKVMLAISDPARYRNAALGNINLWIEQQVQRINKKTLFSKTYSTIVLEHDGIENQIKNELVKICTEHGLSVDQHFVIPDLPPLRIKKDGFESKSIRTYSTSDSRVKLKLQLLLSGKIDDLKSVSEFIDNKIDIVQEIENIAYRSIARVLHKTDPEAAHMYFNHLPSDKRNIYEQEDYNDMTVHRRIEVEILKDLSQFNLSKSHIALSIQQSELTKRVDGMMQGLRRHEVNIQPWTKEEDAEEVVFFVDYKIRGVNKNYWHVFQANLSNSEKEELEAIKKTLEGDLKAKLPNLPIDILRYQDYKTLGEIRKRIIEPVIEKIAQVTGLNIEIINFYRNVTAWEAMKLEDSKDMVKVIQGSTRSAIEESHNSRIRELKMLYDKRLSLMHSNDEGLEDESLEEIDKRIKDITKTIPSFEISKGKVHLKKLKSTKNETFSFDDFSEDTSENANKNRLESGEEDKK